MSRPRPAGVAAALAVVVASALVVLLGADPAGAHANLSRTSPGDGQVLASGPDEIELRFTESVGASDDAITLLDADGETVLGRGAEHPEGDVVVLALGGLDQPLADGGYVVSWRVVSADAHPIRGAFVFHVGDRSSTTVEAAGGAVAAGSDVVGAAYGTVRALVFVSLLVSVGGAAFCALAWPAGSRDPRTRRILGAAVAVAAMATATGFLLQAAYQRGEGLAGALDPAGLAEVAGSRFGVVWLARLALLAAAAVWLRRDPSPGMLVAGGLIGAGLLVTPGAAGHASTGRLAGVALPLDAVHLGAASLWLGGLVVLCTCVLGRADGTDQRAVATRFSRMALVSVVVLAGTGAFQSWRQVAELDQLAGTSFGRLLSVKLGLFAGLVALGALSRSRVARWRRHPALALSRGPGAMASDVDGGGRGDLRRLRRSVAAEVAVAAALLGVTAQLVNAPPARSQGPRPTSVGERAEVTVELDDIVAEVVLDPSRTGRNRLEVVTRDADGQLRHVAELTATLRLPERDIGPFDVDLVGAGHARFAARDVDIPFAGDWELELVAAIDDFDQAEGTTTITVG